MIGLTSRAQPRASVQGPPIFVEADLALQHEGEDADARIYEENERIDHTTRD